MQENINILRLSTSSYMGREFLEKERLTLSEIPGCNYFIDISELDSLSPLILISNSNTNVEVIPKNILNNSILLIHPNSGYENLLQGSTSLDFPIILGNEIRASAVCEYILSCIFRQYSPITNFYFWPNERTWDRELIAEQNALIIGHGHIGKKLSSILKNMVNSLSLYDPYVDLQPQENIQVLDNLDKAGLQKIDIIVLACELNHDNKDMINSNFFKMLGKKCTIINAARGQLINQNDLYDYLEKNPSSYAYLDVFPYEPFSPEHLKSLSNINRTPHIAGVYKSLNKNIIQFEKDIINDFLSYYRDLKIDEFKLKYSNLLLKK